jgi:tetratricopeptide (TPR) repeat protein
LAQIHNQVVGILNPDRTFFPITRDHVFEALGLLNRAIAIDGHYGPTLSWAAICHMRVVNDGWSEALETDRDKATDLARQALQVAQNEPGSLVNSAQVLAYFGEEIGTMIRLVDRALELNPSFARGWYRSGVLRLWAGEPDLAIEHVQASLRLSPRERVGAQLGVIGLAYFFKHLFEQAASNLLLSIQEHPGFPNSYRALASC